VPRRISRKPAGADAVFENLSSRRRATVLVITGGVGLFLAYQAIPTLRDYGFSFFTEEQWSPDTNEIGIAGVLVGTVSVAWSRWSSRSRWRWPARSTSVSTPPEAEVDTGLDDRPDGRRAVDRLRAVGLLPGHAARRRARGRPAEVLGWIPIFASHDRRAPVVGISDPNAAVVDATRYVSSAFCAGIAVAMMVMPMACAVMRQVFSQTPPGEKEAALALGATKWGMIRSVVLPFGRGGIIGGTMLGLGRALGETIAVAPHRVAGLRGQAAHPRDRYLDGQRPSSPAASARPAPRSSPRCSPPASCSS
jgi:phosphate transport system permease protein